MTHDKNPGRHAKPFPEIGEGVSRNEIMAVLADEGYTAGERKGWLKTVLTRLAKDQQENPDARRAELVSEIKDVLDENVSGEPEAEDTL